MEDKTEAGQRRPVWCAPTMTCLDPSGRGIILDVSQLTVRLYAMSAKVCVPSGHGIEVSTEDAGIRPVYIEARVRNRAAYAARFESRDNYDGIPVGVMGGDIIPPPQHMREYVSVPHVWPSSGERYVRQFHQQSVQASKGTCYLVALHPDDVAKRSVEIRLRAVELSQVKYGKLFIMKSA